MRKNPALDTYIQEIESKLCSLPQRTSSQHSESYIGGGQSQLRYIGLRVPQLRQVVRDGFTFSESSHEQMARIWDYVWWNSDCFEVMSLALGWFYDPKQRSLLKSQWPRLKKWSARIDNWAHSDTLSGVYAHLLEQDRGTVLPTLEKWNRSREPWLRRLSIVSLIFYSSQRKKVLPAAKILKLVEEQLDFDHYYVQKGVGWTLREAGNVYPEPTYKFLDKHILRLSAPAFSAATEKLSREQKDRLKVKRKTRRIRQTSDRPL